VYLSAVVGADPRVKTVRVLPVRVVVTLEHGWRPPLTVPLPRALRHFVAGFDGRLYPTLLRPSTEVDRGRRPAAPWPI
jgi:hypothetical protein